MTIYVGPARKRRGKARFEVSLEDKDGNTIETRRFFTRDGALQCLEAFARKAGKHKTIHCGGWA